MTHLWHFSKLEQQGIAIKASYTDEQKHSSVKKFFPLYHILHAAGHKLNQYNIPFHLKV